MYFTVWLRDIFWFVATATFYSFPLLVAFLGASRKNSYVTHEIKLAQKGRRQIFIEPVLVTGTP